MKYKFSEKDFNGYIHSVDNVILTYYIQSIGLKCLDKFILELQKLKDKYSNINYWEKLNVNPCRKYSFYQHVVHLDDGIYILLGHYKDFDRFSKEFTIFPMIRLEINPNKHADKPIFNDFMNIVREYCYDCSLSRYDYAIDVPFTPDKVKVFGTNKEKGLYKGTRYFGQRNKNGFCRIYDKSKEQNLDNPLTRIEHVFSLVKGTKNISFEKIYIENDSVANFDEVSKTDRVIIELCNLCRQNDLEYEDILQKLDRRKRKTIAENIMQCGYSLLEFNEKIHDKLLNSVKEFFNCEKLYEFDYFSKSEKLFEVDVNGFIVVNDDIELPFD